MPHVLLVDTARPASLGDTVRSFFPGTVVWAPEPLDFDTMARRFDAIVVRAESNAGFARVRQLRRIHPTVPIFAVGERDRSAAAYIAGASEYVFTGDRARLLELLDDALRNAGEHLGAG